MSFPRTKVVRKKTLSHAQEDVFLSLPRERKEPKRRAFVRAELAPDESRKDTVVKVPIGTHSSGGIVMLSAKIRYCEHRSAALCAFEHGKVQMGWLASSF